MIRPVLALATGAMIAMLPGCVHAPAEVAAGPAPALSESLMKDAVRTLSSDAFEGREPGTPGEEKTLAYLVDEFTRVGLQPGNNGSWFQDVPLVEITAKDLGELRIGGPAADIRLAPGKDWVGVSYREQDKVALPGSEIVFVGYGIVAPEKNWNDYAGVDMHGKTALILVNDPDWQSDSLEGTFNGRAMTYYGRWTYKFEEAARQGAAAALIVHQDEPAAYGWNVVESSWTGPQAYAEREDGGASQTLVNGWVQKSAAEAIVGAAGQNLAALTAAAQKPGFRPVSLGLTAATAFSNGIRRFDSKNVIGILPGSERPDEYVLQTAHWDHLGHCTADASGDDICNGAIDNATGTAALIALADAHHKAGPTARTQVFLAVTAEESGLLGSEYYGAHPVFPLSQTVGGLNIDALYVTSPARDIGVIGGGKSELDAILDAALKAEGRRASPDSAPQAGYYYRSDHFSLAKRGVPMFYLDSGEDLVDGGVAAGKAYADAYRDNAYHGPADEYDPNWDWSGVMQDLRLFYRLGRTLGESRDWPNWYPNDEFRRIRDESCAGEGGC